MRHAAHFARLVALVVFAVLAFLFVRSKVVPKDFGAKGHFRLSAIADEAAREPRHIGSEACAECHDEIGAAWKAGRASHAASTRVNAETFPLGSMVTYEFPDRGPEPQANNTHVRKLSGKAAGGVAMPACKLVWYDGGLRPPRSMRLT